MKKLLLFIALFVAMAANAQSNFDFGPKLGYQSSYISRSEYDETAISSGSVTFGVFGRFEYNNIIIQPEIMYSGYSFKLSLYNNGIMLDARNHSIAVPVLVGYKFYDNDFLNLRANVGPVMYFGFSDTFKFAGEKIDLNNDAVSYVLEPWTHSPVSLGLALNIGVDIERFTLDFTYSKGLTNVFRDVELMFDDYVFDYIPYKQNVFSFTLGYKFDI